MVQLVLEMKPKAIINVHKCSKSETYWVVRNFSKSETYWVVNKFSKSETYWVVRNFSKSECRILAIISETISVIIYAEVIP